MNVEMKGELIYIERMRRRINGEEVVWAINGLKNHNKWKEKKNNVGEKDESFPRFDFCMGYWSITINGIKFSSRMGLIVRLTLIRLNFHLAWGCYQFVKS